MGRGNCSELTSNSCCTISCSPPINTELEHFQDCGLEHQLRTTGRDYHLRDSELNPILML